MFKLSEALSRLKEFPWANYLLLYVVLFGSLTKRNVGNDKKAANLAIHDGVGFKGWLFWELAPLANSS
ncbi:hypothetical protein [Caldivirga sp.]|uniref:hypothetical protein n=1 Tax=Caldivirga sp. TaxID=2080243 RepID=UPI003D0F0D15